jgi:hypothetical protein
VDDLVKVEGRYSAVPALDKRAIDILSQTNGADMNLIAREASKRLRFSKGIGDRRDGHSTEIAR